MSIGLFVSSCEKVPFEVEENLHTKSVEFRNVPQMVTVTVVSTIISAGEMTVVFSGFEDAENVVLNETQTLDFLSLNGTDSFNFHVLNSDVQGEKLLIVFDAAVTNLLGLDIDETQSIIIIDVTVE